jgi:hypothetical protein
VRSGDVKMNLGQLKFYNLELLLFQFGELYKLVGYVEQLKVKCVVNSFPACPNLMLKPVFLDV